MKPEHKIASPAASSREHNAHTSSSSSSQYTPLTDSPAIAMNDMSLNEEEAEQVWQGSGDEDGNTSVYQTHISDDKTSTYQTHISDVHLLSWEIQESSLQYWQAWTDEVASGAEELERIPLYNEVYRPLRIEEIQQVAKKLPYLI